MALKKIMTERNCSKTQLTEGVLAVNLRTDLAMTMTMTMTEEVFEIALVHSMTIEEGSAVVVVVSSVALLDFGGPTQSAVAFVAFVASVASFVAVAVAAVVSVASFVAVAVAGVAMLEQEPVPSLQVLLFLVMPLQERLLYRLHLRAAVAAVAAVFAILPRVELQYQLPELTVVYSSNSRRNISRLWY